MGTSKDTDDFVELAFRRCGIEFVTAPDDPDAEYSSIVARVGPFKITRGRGYWQVRGDVPIELARLIYTVDTQKVIRSAGHGCAPHPDDYGCEWFDSEGREIVVDPDGSQLHQFKTIDLLKSVDLTKYRFVESLHDVSDRRGIVRSYHIDTQEGLALFVAMIRYAERGKDKP